MSISQTHIQNQEKSMNSSMMLISVMMFVEFLSDLGEIQMIFILQWRHSEDSLISFKALGQILGTLYKVFWECLKWYLSFS